MPLKGLHLYFSSHSDFLILNCGIPAKWFFFSVLAVNCSINRRQVENKKSKDGGTAKPVCLWRSTEGWGRRLSAPSPLGAKPLPLGHWAWWDPATLRCVGDIWGFKELACQRKTAAFFLTQENFSRDLLHLNSFTWQ